MTTVKQALIAARARIDTPEKWIKGDYARVKPGGNTIGPAEANASCWCLQGAIRASKPTYALWQKVNDALIEQLPPPHEFTHIFNDDPATKHEDVLALFDRAIGAQP